jgi:hypothetical protein
MWKQTEPVHSIVTLDRYKTDNCRNSKLDASWIESQRFTLLNLPKIWAQTYRMSPPLPVAALVQENLTNDEITESVLHKQRDRHWRKA